MGWLDPRSLDNLAMLAHAVARRPVRLDDGTRAVLVGWGRANGDRGRGQARIEFLSGRRRTVAARSITAVLVPLPSESES